MEMLLRACDLDRTDAWVLSLIASFGALCAVVLASGGVL